MNTGENISNAQAITVRMRMLQTYVAYDTAIINNSKQNVWYTISLLPFQEKNAVSTTIKHNTYCLFASDFMSIES